MQPLLSSTLLALAALVLVKLLNALIRHARLTKHLPPGPQGLPLLGHIFQLLENPWDRMTEWKEQYGKSSDL